MLLRNYIRETYMDFYTYRNNHLRERNQLKTEITNNIKELEAIVEEELRKFSFLFVFKKVKVNFFKNNLTIAIKVYICPTRQQKKRKVPDSIFSYPFRFCVKGISSDLFMVNIQNEALLQDMKYPTKFLNYIEAMFNENPKVLRLIKPVMDYYKLSLEQKYNLNPLSDPTRSRNYPFMIDNKTRLIESNLESVLGTNIEIKFARLGNLATMNYLKKLYTDRIVVGHIFPTEGVIKDYETITISNQEDNLTLDINVAKELKERVLELLDTLQVASKEYNVVNLELLDKELGYDRFQTIFN